MKNIGDVVWVARLKHREFYETCPDCLGTKAVTLLLANGERESLECKTCWPGGYDPSRGFIIRTQYQLAADKRAIDAMEVGREKTTYRFFDWSSEVVFDNEQEALVEAEKLRLIAEEEDHKRFLWKKEDSRRTWAWHSSYYRRQIADAKKQLAYAEARLNISKAMQRDGVAGQVPA